MAINTININLNRWLKCTLQRFIKLTYVPKTEEEMEADLACDMNVEDTKLPPPPYRNTYSMYSCESTV